MRGSELTYRLFGDLAKCEDIPMWTSMFDKTKQLIQLLLCPKKFVYEYGTHYSNIPRENEIEFFEPADEKFGEDTELQNVIFIEKTHRSKNGLPGVEYDVVKIEDEKALAELKALIRKMKEVLHHERSEVLIEIEALLLKKGKVMTLLRFDGYTGGNNVHYNKEAEEMNLVGRESVEYRKYFPENCPPPHFHFLTWTSKFYYGITSPAISINGLINYIWDLLKTYSESVNAKSEDARKKFEEFPQFGMPFIEICKNPDLYQSVVNREFLENEDISAQDRKKINDAILDEMMNKLGGINSQLESYFVDGHDKKIIKGLGAVLLDLTYIQAFSQYDKDNKGKDISTKLLKMLTTKVLKKFYGMPAPKPPGGNE